MASERTRGADGVASGDGWKARGVGSRRLARDGALGAGGVLGAGSGPGEVEASTPVTSNPQSSTTSRSAVAEVTAGSKRTFARFSSRDTETASRGGIEA